MPTTNGHAVEVGLVLDNHFGWHNHARMIAVATDLGFELDPDAEEVVRRYDADCIDEFPNDPEIVHELMDDAERWLNDHTSSECTHCGQPVELSDSGAWWVHTSISDRAACGVHMSDTAKHYLWHWSDGDFFLSPFCGDECDDEMCACWSFR